MNPNIMGVEVNDTQHKVAAYADDLLFFSSKSETSLTCYKNSRLTQNSQIIKSI